MTAKWEELQIFVAEQLIPILVELWGKYIDPLITKFGELSEEQKKQRIEWGLILAALGPVLIFLGMAAQGVGVLFMFVGKLVVVLKFAHNALWLFAAGLNLSIGVIFLWVAVIAAAIAIGYLIIKNWDKIRDKGQELIEKVRLWWKTWKEKFEAMDNIVGRIGLAFMDHIENKYIKPIMAVIRWVDKAITKLREFFGMEGGKSGELNYTPDLNYTPMQHGGIVPGDVGKPVPILAHGGERILPRGSNIDAPFGGGGGGVTINMTGPIVMDSEERTAQLADKILRILGRQNELSRFGVGF